MKTINAGTTCMLIGLLTACASHSPTGNPSDAPQKVFETNVQSGNVYQLTLDDVVASRGGIPLISEGKLVGAIGCSGGSGSQDEVVAKAGVAAFNK